MKFDNLSIKIDNKVLLQDFNYTITAGSTIVIIGRNGCGKSTFAHGLMGRPGIDVKGDVTINSTNIIELSTHERAKMGLYVSWQTPPEIPGITSFGLIRDVKGIETKNMGNELNAFKDILKRVELPSNWAQRHINVGGSGGERKRAELVNLLSINPDIAILDEIDTGLDTNGLKLVSEIINERKHNNKITLVITHNINLLQTLNFDKGLVFSTHNKMLNEITCDDTRLFLERGYATTI